MTNLFRKWYTLASVMDYLLTPWSRVLLEKITGSQVVKIFYGTRRFITAVTSASHLSLSWAKVSVQVRGFQCEHFVTRYFFTMRSCQHFVQLQSWRNTPCRLSATAYVTYSQLPSILEVVPTSATWGRAMPWWHHGCNGLRLQIVSSNSTDPVRY